MGSSQPRPSCHKVQHQVCNLCVANTRSHSSFHKCASNELGRDLRVCFPSPSDLPQVLEKLSQTKRCILIVVAPFWPKQTWLGSPKINPRKVDSTPPMGENVEVIQVLSVPIQPSHVKPACMLIVQSSLEERGFSTGITGDHGPNSFIHT